MDTTNLQAGLEALTGYDFEQAENAERTAGNMTPDISFSKGFQARLAAKALDVSITDIKNLSIREYAVITTKVMNFYSRIWPPTSRPPQMGTSRPIRKNRRRTRRVRQTGLLDGTKRIQHEALAGTHSRAK